MSSGNGHIVKMTFQRLNEAPWEFLRAQTCIANGVVAVCRSEKAPPTAKLPLVCVCDSFQGRRFFLPVGGGIGPVISVAQMRVNLAQTSV